ncbi:MAG: hypothetical protein ACTSUE_14210 [Promethearchaeota archaeon]
MRQKPKKYLLGLPVANEEMEGIGKVYDLFGPVDEPFLSVSISKNRSFIDASTLTSSSYFVLFDQKQRGYRKGPRKSRKN